MIKILSQATNMMMMMMEFRKECHVAEIVNNFAARIQILTSFAKHQT